LNFKLSEFALKLLVLPWSNAEVERLFSQMNIIKTKTHNKMGTKLLDSIFTIKSGLRKRNTCCLKYQFPPDVLKKIGTLQTYNSTSNPNLVASTSNAPNTTIVGAPRERYSFAHLNERAPCFRDHWPP